MKGLLSGLKPDITPAQIVAFLIAGVPHLLVLLGVDLSAEQDSALDKLLMLAGALIGGDVLLRGARNAANAKIEAAALTPVPSPVQVGQLAAAVEHREPAGVPALEGDDAEGAVDDEERELLSELDAGALPDDAEEFGEGPEPESRIEPDSPDR